VSNWRTDEPPKDSHFIANVGMPYAVCAMWSECHGCYIYANVQVGLFRGEWTDTYFENEMFQVEIEAWMPMPEVSDV